MIDFKKIMPLKNDVKVKFTYLQKALGHIIRI